LAATSRLVVGTGITNIWARTAYATTAAQGVLTRTFPGRFLLGLGSSHQPLVERVYRRRYEQPLAQMRQFLDGMDHAIALLDASQPEGTTASRVLAALGPKMLALAAQQADGAFPYLQTPDHTAMARQALGSDALLVVEQMAVVDESPSAARELARRHLSHYLPLPNYQANLARLGFGEDDLADGGSDRLVDALFAWGDVKAVASRVQEQRSAGADHVAVQVIMPSGRSPATQEWRELSGVLL
jgi:probable F420-dependent oxidoreductase